MCGSSLRQSREPRRWRAPLRPGPAVCTSCLSNPHTQRRHALTRSRGSVTDQDVEAKRRGVPVYVLGDDGSVGTPSAPLGTPGPLRLTPRRRDQRADHVLQRTASRNFESAKTSSTRTRLAHRTARAPPPSRPRPAASPRRFRPSCPCPATGAARTRAGWSCSRCLLRQPPRSPPAKRREASPSVRIVPLSLSSGARAHEPCPRGGPCDAASA